nr:hypothetical protein Q903MT_gene4784 [Picea sitchensis]
MRLMRVLVSLERRPSRGESGDTAHSKVLSILPSTALPPILPSIALSPSTTAR